MRLGVIVSLQEDIAGELAKVRQVGVPTCQLACWNTLLLTPEVAEEVEEAAAGIGIEITAVWAGWPGPAVWDFLRGPSTLGIVPREHRGARMEAIMRASDFASLIGVPDVITHVGFIPENPSDPLYGETVEAVSKLALYCRDIGQFFCFETGQETPVTLLRIINDIGADNLGVNLDPANLLMYGKANPVDALDILGPWVRGVHAKDGEYPTSGRELGVEKPLGQGRVGYDRLVPKLKSLGYSGAVTIEREIAGDQQVADILLARDLLLPLIRGG